MGVFSTRKDSENQRAVSDIVSVTSKSILSGNFPDTECSFFTISENHQTATEKNDMPSMVASSERGKPSLMRQDSTLSIDWIELEEDRADIELLVDHVTHLWETDPRSVIESSGRLVDREECRRISDEMILDRAQLQRICIARKYQLEKATNLFFEQVRFRARWKPKGIQPCDIPNALPSGAWRLCGHTLEGCIISNYKLCYWDPNAYGAKQPGVKHKNDFANGVDEYVRYVIFMLELMIRQMRPAPVPQKFCLIFDLEGFSPSLVFRKNVRAMIAKLMYVAQAQYPERLQKVMLVNAPLGFESAWKLIKPMLDEKTASKVGFCARLSDLLEDIHPTVLSREYGGTHDEYPLPNEG